MLLTPTEYERLTIFTAAELARRRRGKGLMLGIELVKDRATKEPAKAECAHVLETCRDMGLLLGKGGLQGQTIRFSPPMCIHQQDADFILEVLDRALASL